MIPVRDVGLLRLLQVTGTLDPAYGGPPVVVNQLSRSVSELGHSVETVTLDAPTAPFLADCPGPVLALGPAAGGYRYSSKLTQWLKQHAADFDAVVVHGIWQYQSRAVRRACRRAGVPYFLFVHGALDPWFEQRYPGKHAKKSLYWRLSEHRALRDARAVLYTCDEERELAKLSFRPYRATEAVVGLGIEDPPADAGQRQAFLSAHPQLAGRRILLFLGRLHPKKGGDLLIRAFAKVCDGHDDLQLVMAGPDDAGHQAELETLARELDVQDRITWTGMLNGAVKWGAYRSADAFVLTSHSENFGIVISEALACGVPVLITDKVNIWREIDSGGAGFVEPDTEEGATALLNRWLTLTDAERGQLRERARTCFVENFEARAAASSFVDLVAAAVGKAGVM